MNNLCISGKINKALCLFNLCRIGGKCVILLLWRKSSLFCRLYSFEKRGCAERTELVFDLSHDLWAGDSIILALKSPTGTGFAMWELSQIP